jgi:hypothetical protein
MNVLDRTNDLQDTVIRFIRLVMLYKERTRKNYLKDIVVMCVGLREARRRISPESGIDWRSWS